jgi:F-type H+-transporting ATPase subunit epsilon
LHLEDGTEHLFYASGGFLEVQPGFVTLLADTAIRAEDLDEAQAEEARVAAEKMMDDKNSEADFASAATIMSESLAQLRTLEELRRRKR